MHAVIVTPTPPDGGFFFVPPETARGHEVAA